MDSLADVATSQILLPYQQRWVMDRSPIKVAEKSRRIGITWATAFEACVTAGLRQSDGGTDVWYTVSTEDDAREFIEDVSSWTKGLGMMASDIGEVLVEDEDTDILAFRIRYASGNKVTALSSNPRRIRGKDGYAILDEAAHADDMGAFLKAAIAFVMWGTGRVALISTHNGVMSEFNQFIESVRAGETRASMHRTTLDDALAEGLFVRMCQRNGRVWTQEAQDEWREELFDLYGEDAGEELMCTPSGAGGRYLHRRVIEQCMDRDAPVLRLKLEDDFATLPELTRQGRVQKWIEAELLPQLEAIPKYLDMYFGEDFGRVGDLTVLCPMYLAQDMARRVPFLLEMRNVPFDQQKQVIWACMDHFAKIERLAGGLFDSGGNGQYIAESAALRYGGASIRQTYLAAGPPRDDDDRKDADGNHKPSLRYSEALPPMKAAMEDRMLTIPQDKDVAMDLGMFERKNGLPCLPNPRAKATDRTYRHGDSGVAIMLAYYATMEMHVAPWSLTVPKRDRRATL